MCCRHSSLEVGAPARRIAPTNRSNHAAYMSFMKRYSGYATTCGSRTNKTAAMMTKKDGDEGSR